MKEEVEVLPASELLRDEIADIVIGTMVFCGREAQLRKADQSWDQDIYYAVEEAITKHTNDGNSLDTFDKAQCIDNMLQLTKKI